MQRIMFLVALMLFAVACGHKKDAKSFERALEGQSGQPHSIVKLYTQVGDYVVYKNDVTGEYLAFNMKSWDRETMTTVEQFMAVAGPNDVVRNLSASREWVESGYWQDVYIYDEDYVYDSYCDCWQWETEQIYAGQEWVDTSHYSWFYYGGGFRFDNTSTMSRDLDTIAALKEEVAEKMIAMKLQGEFSLSNDRASELAKLANRYQKLESARELTAGEKDKFAMDALGVSMTQVEKALKSRAQGNEASYESLLQTAAQVNSTTPEQIGRFFEEMVGTEI